MKAVIYSLFFCFFSGVSFGQPGWQDLTERYFYAITDENGKEISFKKNKAYSIMIDDVLYKSPNIPQHKLKTFYGETFNYNRGCEIQIRINDFSFVALQQEYENRDTELEIKIIHKKDTLFISQSSGVGSGDSAWITVDGVYKYQRRPADFTLQFIPGHYFFPDWAKQQIENVPETSGKVKIRNQQNFIVSEISNPTILQKTRKYREDRYNSELHGNFVNGYFSLEHTVEPTQIEDENPALKYSAIKELFLPAQGDEYNGLIEFHYESPDLKTDVVRFATINIEENTVKLWTPIKNTPYFSTNKVYNDKFNKILYSRTVFKDTTCQESQLNKFSCPFKERYYSSTDNGKTWHENNEMNQLFVNDEMTKLEFLDAEYALAYRRRDDKPRRVTQGIYYLLKNMQIVDSLVSPELHYGDNYNNYRYTVKRDTVFLGSWQEEPTNYYSAYFQPYLTKVDGSWKFNIEKRTGEIDRYTNFYSKSSLDSIKDYQNFTLVNKNKLIFKNGAGTLTLKEDVVDDLFHFGSYHILENGNQIYLINCNEHIYFSHDGGTTWFLYPSSLLADRSSYHNYRSYRFLKIDEQGTISYLDYEWNQEGTRKIMKKMYYQFLME